MDDQKDAARQDPWTVEIENQDHALRQERAPSMCAKCYMLYADRGDGFDDDGDHDGSIPLPILKPDRTA